MNCCTVSDIFASGMKSSKLLPQADVTALSFEESKHSVKCVSELLSGFTSRNIVSMLTTPSMWFSNPRSHVSLLLAESFR